jgi:hypothetical protein
MVVQNTGSMEVGVNPQTNPPQDFIQAVNSWNWNCSENWKVISFEFRQWNNGSSGTGDEIQ